MPRRVSVKDVARSANVSIATVSNYLNKTKAVSPETREHIEAAIVALDYRRNEIASSLRRARTQALGIVLPNISNPFYTSLFEGAEAEAQRRGYTLTLGVTHYDGEVLRKYLGDFRSRQMDGIIVDGFNTDYGEDVLNGVDVPVVVVEPPAAMRAHSSIRIDNFAAGREAVAHLIARGHRRIAIMTPSIGDDRYFGYRAALEMAGIDIDSDLVFPFGGPRPVAEGSQPSLIQQGAAAMAQLLDRARFTACFVALDIFAIGAMKTLRERGLGVPRDVALVGFDDIPVAAAVSPPLTTVAQPHREMGRLAVDTLLQRLSGETQDEATHHVLSHHLIVRESS